MKHTKTWMIQALAVVMLASLATTAHALDEEITVTFDSIKELTAKNGDTLDGSVKFIFADEKGSSTGGTPETSQAMTKSKRDREEGCRWALLGSFLKIQKKAKMGNKKVFGNVKTGHSNMNPSGKRNKCVCLAGGFMTRSTITGNYQ